MVPRDALTVLRNCCVPTRVVRGGVILEGPVYCEGRLRGERSRPLAHHVRDDGDGDGDGPHLRLPHPHRNEDHHHQRLRPDRRPSRDCRCRCPVVREPEERRAQREPVERFGAWQQLSGGGGFRSPPRERGPVPGRGGRRVASRRMDGCGARDGPPQSLRRRSRSGR